MFQRFLTLPDDLFESFFNQFVIVYFVYEFRHFRFFHANANYNKMSRSVAGRLLPHSGLTIAWRIDFVALPYAATATGAKLSFAFI